MTHTYAIMEVSHATYDEVRARLLAAGYEHQIGSEALHLEVLDMHGIGLQRARISMNLLPFGSYPECPKCGGRTGQAEVRYSTNHEIVGTSGSFIGTGRHGDVPVPHLLKHCPHCKFGWMEQTKDAT